MYEICIIIVTERTWTHGINPNPNPVIILFSQIKGFCILVRKILMDIITLSALRVNHYPIPSKHKPHTRLTSL